MDLIIETLQQHQLFRSSDIAEINQSIDVLFNDYIKANVMTISSPQFEKNVTLYIYTNLSEQLAHLYGISMLYRVQTKLKKLITIRKSVLYTTVMPRRSLKTSFIRNIKISAINRDAITRQLELLKNMIQPVQRSPEWYIFRHNLLTASSIWKALGSQASKNQLIYEKCMPFCEHRHAPIDSPLHWGQKYEPVSAEFYKRLYNTKISDFGCIQHPKFKFIGASPYVINTDPFNPRYGRMLEIKNIVNREIDGNPKIEYWIQMQLQMETCGLNECDFLETKFVEYQDEEAFNNDKETDTKKSIVKGRIILFSINSNLHYEYAPLGSTDAEYNEWEKHILAKNAHGEWIQNIYWKLEKYSCVLILRNKLWLQNAIPYIAEIWNTIVEERLSGFDHRAPKKRKLLGASGIIVNKCYINVEDELLEIEALKKLEALEALEKMDICQNEN